MWRVTWKGLLAHKLRLALTGLAIVLGVTFVSGTLVLTDTMHNTFTSLFSSVYQNVDLEVRGTAVFKGASASLAVRNPFPASVLADVRKVPGVTEAQGNVSGYAQFETKQGTAVNTSGAPTFGMAFVANSTMSSLKLVTGEAPRTSTQVAMDEGTATKFGFRVGDVVTVLLPGTPQRFTLTGVFRFGTVNNLAGATIAGFTLPTAQRLFGKVGELDTIDVSVAPGTSVARVQRAIAAVLPKGVEVVTGQTVANESTSAVDQALGIFSTALLIFALIALFVGSFTIFNTLSILVTQRTRELALLRIVGASRRQIFRSVLAEAFVLGVVASVVGLGLGVLTALGLTALLNAFGIDLPTGSLVFATRTVFVALAVGVGVTLASSIGPARRAVRIPPVAVLAAYQGVTTVSNRRRSLIGAGLSVVGALVVGVGLVRSQILFVGVGAVAAFLGVGTLAPFAVPPLARIIGRPLAALGISSRLGRENSLRNPRRTAHTASALMVGMALVSTMAIFGASLARSATSSVTNAVSADYIVSSSSAGNNVGFSAAAISAVSSVPGVGTVSPIYAGQFKFHNSVATVVALTRADVSSTVIVHAVHGSVGSALEGGALLVDATTAASDHLYLGSRVPVTFAETGATTMTIGAIYQANALLGSYVVGASFFHSHFTATTLPFAVLLRTSGGSSAATSSALANGLKDFPNLKIQTRAAFIKSEQAQVNQLLGLVYALLALAILIALIGIVNTLMLSVFERTHEIGLLRAVGMRRQQVKAMIRSESVIIAVFGAIVGILIGTGLGVALVSSLSQHGITEMVVPVASLLAFLVLAALLGLVAASWPARRAARLNVLDAIAAE